MYDLMEHMFVSECTNEVLKKREKTNGTHVKNPVISHEWEKDRIVMTNEISMVICEKDIP
jgi:hypothetical protein